MEKTIGSSGADGNVSNHRWWISSLTRSGSRSLLNVSIIAAAFPIGTATPKRCLRYSVALFSPRNIRLPKSLTKLRVLGPSPPNVSTATDRKKCVCDMAEYLLIFRDSASSATHGPGVAAWVENEAARRCTQVKSHAMGRPKRQGIMVTPSGLLLTSQNITAGSNSTGI